MSKLGLVCTLMFVAVGCGEVMLSPPPPPPSCTVACVTDDDCPASQTCGEAGLCTSGEACPCEPNAFLGCNGDSALRCNAEGTAVATETCAAGCNADAARCNACEPNTATCAADGETLEHCGADGLVAGAETCALSCVDGASSTAAHCEYIEPTFLPDACDQLASDEQLEIASTTTFDTSDDVVCNGGVVAQTGGPEICVVRYGTIAIHGALIVRGGRALALVADESVIVTGTLDVSADGAANGPGGGTIVSGARAVRASGGGGAGFATAGGNGGGALAGGGGAGGAVVDPLSTGVFVGGPRPALPTFQQVNYPVSGGGGGAVTVIACRGTVSVSGTIDASGGGGGGGRDSDPVLGATSQNYVGGAGGGAGGYVVLQGIEVRVSSPTGYGVFANGGGGGGGCTGDNCIGGAGADGRRSTANASGGTSSGEGAMGGTGGALSPPAPGYGAYYSPGGGGGSAGRVQTFTPAAGRVMVSSTNSPYVENNRTIATR